MLAGTIAAGHILTSNLTSTTRFATSYSEDAPDDGLRPQLESDTRLRWQEDASQIRATIRSLHDEELILFLSLRNGGEVQHYTAAPVPYVCPDMKR